jgi:eukaryotic-like serine/threonine-protein kinase
VAHGYATRRGSVQSRFIFHRFSAKAIMEASGVAEGSILGKYRMIAEIGRGGMADVYLAVAQGPGGFNKLVVIKERRGQLAQDPEFLTMFLDEARIAARLNHPNIVQTYEVGQDGDRYFIAMEFLDGQPLNRIRSRFRERDDFTLAMHVRIIADVLAALQHAHELADFDGRPLEVVHRDVTPQNVFVTYDGHTKLVDFGIAKTANSSSETRTGVLKGKIGYMSPEQARGERVDRCTDIFAVGVMLWESAVRQRMFKGLTDIATLGKVIHGDIPSMRAVRPDVPEAIERICARALSVRREDRYPSAAEMQNDLEQYLAATGERVATRDIAKVVAQAFAEDRARIKSLIDEQLRLIRSTSKVTSLPVIEPSPRISLTHTGLTPPNEKETRPSGHPVQTSPSLVGSTASEQLLFQPRRSRVGVLLGALVIGAAIGTVVLMRSVPEPAAPNAQSAQQGGSDSKDKPGEAAAQSNAPSRGFAELKVNVNPPDARLFLDDAVLATGSYTGKLPMDGRVYRLRAEAQGYLSRVEMIEPTKDISISIKLDKVEAKTASVRTKGTPASPGAGKAQPAEPPEEVFAKPAARTKKEIDSESPYAK